MKLPMSTGDLPQSGCVRNPYPGLRPFTENESQLLFGREGQADVLLSRLAAQRFLAVVGTSGSGKSSLVKAALLPAMRAGYLDPDGLDWIVVSFEPGSEPLARLAAGLAGSTLHGLPPDVEAALRESSFGLRDLLARCAAPGSNVLILVDQFEELFRAHATVRVAENPALCRARDEQTQFVKLLLEASASPGGNAYVLIAMRSEYLGQCARFRGLPEAMNAGQYLIPRLTRAQLRLTIEGPARYANTAVSNRLVQRLLNDAGEDTDELPLLQHAMMRTWDNWSRTHTSSDGSPAPMDLVHYEAVGKMGDALCRHANEAFDEAKRVPGGERICKLVFQRLRERDANDDEVRRPTRVQELLQVTDASLSALSQVLAPFRAAERAFLLPGPEHALSDATEINVSHECLFRKWTLLAADWAPEELRARDRYQDLVKRSEARDTMANAVLLDRLDWWRKRKPNAPWAARYGGDFEAAHDFLRRAQVRLWLRGLAIVLLIALGGVAMAWMGAESNYRDQVDRAMADKQRVNQQLSAHLIVQAAVTRSADIGTARVAAWLAAAGYASQHVTDENARLEAQRVFWKALSAFPLRTRTISTEQPARQIAIGGRGTLLAVSDAQGAIRVHSLETGAASAPLRAGGAAKHIELSVDGSVVAAVTQQRLRVWQRGSSGTFDPTPALDEACDGSWLSLTETGERMVATCGNVARMFSRQDGASWREHPHLGSAGMGWVLSRDGRRASGMREGDTYHYIQRDLSSAGCDWQSNKPRSRCETSQEVPAVLYWEVARDDLRIWVTAQGNRTINMGGAVDSTSPSTLEAAGDVERVLLADGGRTLLSLSLADRASRATTLQVWRISGDGLPREIARLPLGKLEDTDPAFDSFSGQLAVVDGDGQIKLIQLSAKQAFGFVLPPAAGQEGALAVGSLSAETEAVALRLDAQKLSFTRLPAVPCAASQRIGVSDSGSTLIVMTCRDNWPRRLESYRFQDGAWLRSSEPRTLDWLGGLLIGELKLSADDKRLAWIQNFPAPAIRHMELDVGEMHTIKLPGTVRAVSLTAKLDQAWIATDSGESTVLQRCDLSGETCPVDDKPPFQVDGTVTRLAASDDGRYIAVAHAQSNGAAQASVQIVTAQGARLQPIAVQSPRALVFSPSGERLITLDASAARVWQWSGTTVAPREIARFPADTDTRSAAFSHDADHVFLVGADAIERFPLQADLIEQACRRIQPELSNAEWSEALPQSVEHQRLCPAALAAASSRPTALAAQR